MATVNWTQILPVHASVTSLKLSLAYGIKSLPLIQYPRTSRSLDPSNFDLPLAWKWKWLLRGNEYLSFLVKADLVMRMVRQWPNQVEEMRWLSNMKNAPDEGETEAQKSGFCFLDHDKWNMHQGHMCAWYHIITNHGAERKRCIICSSCQLPISHTLRFRSPRKL